MRGIGHIGHIGPIGHIRLIGLIGLIGPIGLIGLISLISCSGDQPEPQPVVENEVAIGFTARCAESPSTKATRAGEPAPGDGELTTELLKELSFGVYCWYTGSTFFDPDFTAHTHIKDYLGATGYMLMRNQKVEWKSWDGVSDSWGYTPKKYWPTNPTERLTLRAYAPYTDYLVTDNHGMPQLPVIVENTDYHNGTQHDPLWGTGKHDGTVDGDDAVTDNEVYGKHYNNYTYQMSGNLLATDDRDGIIYWYFHHGMSKLMFSCTITPDPGCDNVTITGISISPLYKQGLLSMSSATTSSEEKPTWTERGGNMTVTLGEDDLIEKPLTITVSTEPGKSTGPENLLDKGLLIIPRNFGAPATPMTITVTYYIDDNSSDPQTAEATLTSEFFGNTSYTMGLSLTPSTKGLEIDLVQSAFTPWIELAADHTVYNW